MADIRLTTCQSERKSVVSRRPNVHFFNPAACCFLYKGIDSSALLELWKVQLSPCLIHNAMETYVGKTTGSGAHPASSPMGTGSSLPEG
jgi:hypothetical protein